LKSVLYQVSFETPASLHSKSVLGSVGGLSENGVLPLIFFSVVGVGIGRLSVIVGSLCVIRAFSSHGVQDLCYSFVLVQSSFEF
jgi:hypothetical protein